MWMVTILRLVVQFVDDLLTEAGVTIQVTVFSVASLEVSLFHDCEDQQETILFSLILWNTNILNHCMLMLL